MPTELTVGALAPAFAIAQEGGGTASLELIRRNGLVLFFYPKANTPGCTLEARAFTALKPAFDRLDVGLLGISADPVKRLTAFRAKQALDVPLATDETHAMLTTYGVWREKSLFGFRHMGIVRTTVLIDGDGRVAEVWHKVKVDGHAEAVLAAATALADPADRTGVTVEP